MITNYYYVNDGHAIKRFLAMVANTKCAFPDLVVDWHRLYANHRLAAIINAWLPQALPLAAQYDSAKQTLVLIDNDCYLWQTVAAWQAAHRHGCFLSNHDEQVSAADMDSLLTKCPHVTIAPAPYDAYMQFGKDVLHSQGQWYNQQVFTHNQSVAANRAALAKHQAVPYPELTNADYYRPLLITDIVVSRHQVVAAQQRLQQQLVTLAELAMPANAHLQTQLWQSLIPTFRQVAMVVSDGYRPVANMSADVTALFLRLLDDANDDHVVESDNDNYLRLTIKQRQHLLHYLLSNPVAKKTDLMTLPISNLPANVSRQVVTFAEGKHHATSQLQVFMDLSGLQTIL